VGGGKPEPSLPKQVLPSSLDKVVVVNGALKARQTACRNVFPFFSSSGTLRIRTRRISPPFPFSPVERKKRAEVDPLIGKLSFFPFPFSFTPG